MTASATHPRVLRCVGLLTRCRHAGDASLLARDPALARLPAALSLQSAGFSHGGAMPRLCAHALARGRLNGLHQRDSRGRSIAPVH